MKRSVVAFTLFGIFLVSLVFVSGLSAWGHGADSDTPVFTGTSNDDKYLAIVDVYVTNRGSGDINPPFGDPDYTGLTFALHSNGNPLCTVPYDPNTSVGAWVIPADINAGIGGDFVHIWAKYDWVAPTDDTPVLVDLAAHHWPYWNANCPEGWGPARGDNNGALTTRADDDCNRVGLCVHYLPMNETDRFISNLSISFPGNPGTLPPLCPANGGYWPMYQDAMDIHSGCGDGKWMYLGFNKAGKWPPMPASLTVADTEKFAKLEKYAPRVWLANSGPDLPIPISTLPTVSEIYFPSSVEWAFEHMDRVYHNNAWWLFTKEGLGSPSSVLPYFHGCDGVSTDAPCSLDETPVYAFWDDAEITVAEGINPGYSVKVYDLIYFLFFPYNRGKEVASTVWGNHVGDWEHVSVRLMPHWSEQMGWSLKPHEAYLSAHNFGSSYKWEQIPKKEYYSLFFPAIMGQEILATTQQRQKVENNNQFDETTSGAEHPIVYAAWGSHGIWLDPGAHVYDSAAGTDLVDWTGPGTSWDTWRNVEAYDYDNKIGLGDSTWPLWMSKDYANPSIGDANPASRPVYRWGNNEEGCYGWPINYCRLDSGPTGPVDKGVWDQQHLR